MESEERGDGLSRAWGGVTCFDLLPDKDVLFAEFANSAVFMLWKLLFLIS